LRSDPSVPRGQKKYLDMTWAPRYIKELTLPDSKHNRGVRA